MTTTSPSGGAPETRHADALVFSVGVRAMQAIVAASPGLLGGAPDLAGVARLGTVDAAALRLWLDRRVAPATASNVAVGFHDGVGATFFDLNALQVGTPGR